MSNLYISFDSEKDPEIRISNYECMGIEDYDLYNVDLEVDGEDLNSWMGISNEKGDGVRKKSIGCSSRSSVADLDLDGYKSEYGDDDELWSMDEGSDADEVPKIPKFNPDNDKGEPLEFVIGKEYPNHIVFREQLREYAFSNGFDFILLKNDKTRVTAICREHEVCNWRIHASWNIKETSFVVKTFQSKHTCEMQFYNSKVTARWIANEFFDQISDDNEIANQTLQKLVKRRYNIHASEQQCYRAKRIVANKIYGDEIGQYSKLADYCEAIKHYNPGSSAILKTDGEDRFLRIYICLDACKKGFKNGCRPIIGIDACHLKVFQSNQLLAATGIDANNNIFPIAYAICEIENYNTWKWFLENLLQDIGDWESNRWIFISDQQKGLEGALEELMPGVDHRICVRHLYNNFKKYFRGDGMKKCLCDAATSTTKSQFETTMQELGKLCPNAATWLHQIPVEKWSRHAFSTWPRCAILLNNVSESFNSYIRKARDKPIIVMLETIRGLLMKRFNVKREGMREHARDVCPRICEILRKNRKHEREYTVKLAGVGEFEVLHKLGSRNVVNLKTVTCTCNGWQLTGIPCVHACSAIVVNRQDPEKYIHHCYSKSTFMDIYSEEIHGIPSSEHWPKSLIIVKPPIWRRQPGRPKKKRNKEAGEKDQRSSSKRQRIKTRSLKCSRCRDWGHNVRTCKGPSKPKTKKVQRARDNIKVIKLDNGRKQVVRMTDQEAQVDLSQNSNMQRQQQGNWSEIVTSFQPQQLSQQVFGSQPQASGSQVLQSQPYKVDIGHESIVSNPTTSR